MPIDNSGSAAARSDDATKRRFLVRIGGVALTIGSLGFMAASRAQTPAYPERPVKLVVPYAPGGPTDVVGRAMALVLADKLRAPVVVENRAGSGGVIGTQSVATAPADGYTLLLGLQGPITINPALSKVPYDPFRDLTAVRMIATAPSMVMMASKKTGVRSAADLAAAAKASPAGLNFASAGIGTLPHLAAETVRHHTGLNLTHVPYKGAGPAQADLGAGHVDLLFSDLQVALPMIQGGKVTALAVTGPARSSTLPDVPTTAEVGFGSIPLGWYGVFAPRNVPSAVVGRLNQAFDAIFEDPRFRQVLDRQGAKASTASHAEFVAFLRAEHEQWTRLGKAITIRME